MAGWLDVGGLGFAENRAAWMRASGLEEHEGDDGSGPRCSGKAVWDTRPSSWSSSACLCLNGQLFALSTPTSRAAK